MNPAEKGDPIGRLSTERTEAIVKAHRPYAYSEKAESAFDRMSFLARTLERENAVLIGALHVIKNQSVGDDWTAEQALEFIKQYAKSSISRVPA